MENHRFARRFHATTWRRHCSVRRNNFSRPRLIPRVVWVCGADLRGSVGPSKALERRGHALGGFRRERLLTALVAIRATVMPWLGTVPPSRCPYHHGGTVLSGL